MPRSPAPVRHRPSIQRARICRYGDTYFLPGSFPGQQRASGNRMDIPRSPLRAATAGNMVIVRAARVRRNWV